MAFAKIKTLIRKAAARTYDELWQAVENVCNLTDDEECYTFFKAEGYETDRTQPACLVTFPGSGVRLEPLSGPFNMPDRGGGCIVTGLVANDRFTV